MINISKLLINVENAVINKIIKNKIELPIIRLWMREKIITTSLNC